MLRYIATAGECGAEIMTIASALGDETDVVFHTFLMMSIAGDAIALHAPCIHTIKRVYNGICIDLPTAALLTSFTPG